jgi:hypothetical protein
MNTEFIQTITLCNFFIETLSEKLYNFLEYSKLGG